MYLYPNNLRRTFDRVGATENNAAASPVHPRFNPTNSIRAGCPHGQDECYRRPGPPGTYVHISNSRTSCVSYHLSFGLGPLPDASHIPNEFFLLAENPHYVFCKYATTSSSAAAYAAFLSGPTRFRRTATLLAVSYAYTTDAYTPSL